MRESTEYRPTPALAEPALSLGPAALPQAPSGHGSLGAHGEQFLAGWEGLKAIYRAAVVSSAAAHQAYRAYLDTPRYETLPDVPDFASDPAGWPDPTEPAHLEPPYSPQHAAALFAVYEGMQPIVSAARMAARIAWGDETESALYHRLCADATAAGHQHHAA